LDQPTINHRQDCWQVEHPLANHITNRRRRSNGRCVKKQTLRLLTYGLYILTAAAEGELAGGTITWLSQASFTPPLVMVGVKVDSKSARPH